MGALTRAHVLSWELELTVEGYTVATLRDTAGRRFGWIVNAGLTGWTAHTGDFGDAAERLGLPPAPIVERVEQIADLPAARAWVEQTIADEWHGRPPAPRLR